MTAPIQFRRNHRLIATAIVTGKKHVLLDAFDRPFLVGLDTPKGHWGNKNPLASNYNFIPHSGDYVKRAIRLTTMTVANTVTMEFL